MKQNISLNEDKNTESARKYQVSSNKYVKNDKNSGFGFLKKGQQINGLVVSVGKQITLDFNGHQVVASKDVLKNAKPGQIRRFEVVNATLEQMELKEVDSKENGDNQGVVTVTRVDSDQATFMARKEYTGKQMETEKEVLNTKIILDDIVSRLSSQECRLIEQEGFSVEMLTVEALYSALNRAREKVTKVTEHIKGKENTENTEYTQKKNSLEKEKVQAYEPKEIETRLKEENLLSTNEVVQSVSAALSMCDTISKMNENTEKYLIGQGMEPTIENIYKAYYNGNVYHNEPPQSLSSEAWNELQPQVTEIIDSTGYEINKENKEDARWLIEHNLPLTKQSFSYKKELDNMVLPIDKEIVLDRIIDGMKDGTDPKDIALTTKQNLSYEQLMNDINSIKNETVIHAIEENTELTIKKLASTQNNNIEFDKEAPSQTDEVQIEVVKAQRQLEEIRLKMTVESASKMVKMGFDIETERLEKVVDALREMEDAYYRSVLNEAEVDTSEKNIQVLKETEQSIERLKFIPSHILGITLSERKNQTIPSLLQEGSNLQNELKKAGQAYDTLMTVPNSQYGDTIHKAFQNIEAILAEMDMENTQLNQRAVRILGYNSMEITKENINHVKAYDLEVSTMVRNLNPAVAVRLVKEGINPLNMPINELNQAIETLKEEQGISTEEKYSTYLRRLEKQNDISSEERKAYIGIYRLLHNIEKTDGAALGAVLKSNRDITLNHMLSAVRTMRKGSLDTVIDDEFGTLTSISYENETINEQLSAVFSEQLPNYENSSQLKNDNESIKDQTEYYSQMIKAIKEEILPENRMSQQELVHTVLSEQQATTEDKGIWEGIKNIPVEKLFEQLQNTSERSETKEVVYAEKAQELRENYKNANQAVRFLNEFKLPNNANNIMMSKQLLSNGESLFKKLIKQQKENKVESSENSLKEIAELSDKLIDRDSMSEAFEQIEDTAKVAIEKAYTSEYIDSMKLAELKTIGNQMTFLKTLANKEFYQIPIETEGGITNLNLTILRGSETTGKVSIDIQSEQLGNVKADFSLKDKTLIGFVSGDNRDGLEELHKHAAEIERAAEEQGITIKQLDFGVPLKGSEGNRYNILNNEEESKTTQSNNERELYRVAKAMVQTVRAAEKAKTEENRFAS